jgi:hypothetical protein
MLMLNYFIQDARDKLNYIHSFFNIESISNWVFIIIPLSPFLVIAAIFVGCAFVLYLALYAVVAIWNKVELGTIAFWGISESVEAEGIRLINRAKTTNRLVLWQEISQVNEVFKPPCFSLEFILKSGEAIEIDFRSFGDLELALRQHQIPFKKLQ